MPIWTFPFDVFKVSIPLEARIFEGYSAPGWVLILYVVVIGTVCALPLCVMNGLRNLSAAATTSAFGMLEPIFAGAVAWFWFSESWTVHSITVVE
jgi:drug/metabolite transporter (DMT)-like permease